MSMPGQSVVWGGRDKCLGLNSQLPGEGVTGVYARTCSGLRREGQVSRPGQAVACNEGAGVKTKTGSGLVEEKLVFSPGQAWSE